MKNFLTIFDPIVEMSTILFAFFLSPIGWGVITFWGVMYFFITPAVEKAITTPPETTTVSGLVSVAEPNKGTLWFGLGNNRRAYVGDTEITALNNSPDSRLLWKLVLTAARQERSCEAVVTEGTKVIQSLNCD
jgi:hypothetical protein